MQPALKIEIGTYSFTDRKINPRHAGAIVRKMVEALGIDVDIAVTQTDKSDFLLVKGYVCRFPDELVKQVEDYVHLLEQVSDKKSKEDLFWELLITNIIWLQPQALFSDECLGDFMPQLINAAENKVKDIRRQYKDILIELLELKIYLNNKALIIEISNNYLNNEKIDWNQLREELVRSLFIPRITVLFNEAYFNEVITAGANENLFEMMRDGLFYETGIQYPPVKVEFDTALPYNAFYFKLNNYESIPATGLMNEVMANDTPDRLRLLNITGRAAVNPAYGNPVSFIASVDKKIAESEGLTTWDGLGYFILCFSSILRKYGYLYIDCDFTRKYMETLKEIFPRIIELIAEENLFYVTVKTLRLLAKEEISIRNLRVILEAILESDYIVADSNKYNIFDERVPVESNQTSDWKSKAENIVEFARIRLKKYVSYKYTRGQNTLVVYLLDPEIAKITGPAFDPTATQNNDTYRKINDAVHGEIGNSPLSSQVPVILTSVNVRSHIKKIIETGLPHIAVLSHQELSPDINIQPIARIF